MGKYIMSKQIILRLIKPIRRTKTQNELVLTYRLSYQGKSYALTHKCGEACDLICICNIGKLQFQHDNFSSDFYESGCSIGFNLEAEDALKSRLLSLMEENPLSLLSYLYTFCDDYEETSLDVPAFKQKYIEMQSETFEKCEPQVLKHHTEDGLEWLISKIETAETNPVVVCLPKVAYKWEK